MSKKKQPAYYGIMMLIGAIAAAVATGVLTILYLGSRKPVKKDKNPDPDPGPDPDPDPDPTPQ
jgi:hypothetical protein